MSIDVWGLLPKSQIDAETIEEAIDRIVAAHNDDPDAHTGGGRAIEMHRSNEVLDHLPGSVLADKITANELDVQTFFETLTNWQITGTVVNDILPGARLFNFDYFDTNDPAPARLHGISGSSQPYLDWSKNSLFEVVVWEEYQNDDHDITAGWFNYVSLSDMRGMGFYIHDNVIKGFLGRSGSLQLTGSIGSGIHTNVRLRVVWNAIAQQADYYVNGELVASLTDSALTGVETSAIVDVRNPDTGSQETVLYVNFLRYAYSFV